MRIGLPSRLDRQRQCQKGSVAIEFAIVGIWLGLVLGAIIETGVFLLIQSNLQDAAETAGRRIRTNQVPTTTLLAQFKTDVCAEIIVHDCTNHIFVDVRSDNDFADLAAAIPFETDKAPTVGPGNIEIFEPGGADQWGSLIITYDWRFNTPMLHHFFENLANGNRRLVGFTIFKNEP